MRQAPRFWFDEGGIRGLSGAVLSPLGGLYGAIVAAKIKRARPQKAPVPVVCVGNVTLGGVGKTPFADFLCRTLNQAGHTPFILMRGYGGKLKGPVRASAHHRASDIGDEGVLQAKRWPVIISQDRPAGAALAASEGATVIVMDDGFQNPSLQKTLSLLLIDGEVPFGNGRVFPAGPLRETVSNAVGRSDAVVVVNPTGRESQNTVRNLASAGAPLPLMLKARLEADVSPVAIDRVAHAFSGIGRPEKFFDDLVRKGIILTRTTSFADHHPYTEADILTIKQAAERDDAQILTTMKDFVRLAPSAVEGITPVPARMSVSDPVALEGLLATSLGAE